MVLAMCNVPLISECMKMISCPVHKLPPTCGWLFIGARLLDMVEIWFSPGKQIIIDLQIHSSADTTLSPKARLLRGKATFLTAYASMTPNLTQWPFYFLREICRQHIGPKNALSF